MDRNLQLLEAVMLKLRAEALEQLTTADLMLKHPEQFGNVGIDEIIKCTQAAMLAENTLSALQMYFAPPQEQQPAQQAAPEPDIELDKQQSMAAAAETKKVRRASKKTT